MFDNLRLKDRQDGQKGSVLNHDTVDRERCLEGFFEQRTEWTLFWGELKAAAVYLPPVEGQCMFDWVGK